MDHPQSCVSGSRKSLKIVYDDSDATDSSSDERNNINVDKKTKRKRVVLKIAFPNVPSDQTVDNGLNKNDKSCGIPKHEVNKNNKSCGTQNHEVTQPPCKYRGVRMRKCGRYSAEIRNRMTGKRHWLGTFGTAEDASKAYEAKRLEFETTYKKDFHKEKRIKRLKTVSFAEPLVVSNDSKRETSDISLSSPELVNNVEVSNGETNSLPKTDIVQEPNVVASVDASSQLESNWLTFDESMLDLDAGVDESKLDLDAGVDESKLDLDAGVDDSNGFDIAFDFDYFGTQFAVYPGIEEPRERKRSSIKELPKQIKEPRNIPGQ